MTISRYHRIAISFYTAVLLAGCSSPPVEGEAETSTSETGAKDAVASGREKGTKEATAAVAAGKLLWKEYPAIPYPPWHRKYVELLKNRCGVDYQVMSLPPGVKEEDFMEENRGWNEVVKAEVERKHGAGILSQLMTEAKEK